MLSKPAAGLNFDRLIISQIDPKSSVKPVFQLGSRSVPRREPPRGHKQRRQHQQAHQHVPLREALAVNDLIAAPGWRAQQSTLGTAPRRFSAAAAARYCFCSLWDVDIHSGPRFRGRGMARHLGWMPVSFPPSIEINSGLRTADPSWGWRGATNLTFDSTLGTRRASAPGLSCLGRGPATLGQRARAYRSGLRESTINQDHTRDSGQRSRKWRNAIKESIPAGS